MKRGHRSRRSRPDKRLRALCLPVAGAICMFSWTHVEYDVVSQAQHGM